MTKLDRLSRTATIRVSAALGPYADIPLLRMEDSFEREAMRGPDHALQR